MRALDAPTPAPFAVDLTSGSPADLLTVPVPDGKAIAGRIAYWIEVSDGTDLQAIASEITYQAINKAGTVSGSAVTFATVDPSAALSDPASTLDVSADVTTGVGTMTIRLTVTTSLTATLLRVHFNPR